MKRFIVLMTIFCILMASGQAIAEDRHRIGGGAHYWYTIDDIDVEEIDEDGLAWIISYQFVPSPIFKLEADVEIFPSGFGGSESTVFAPQVLGLLGSWIYGGLGIGVYLNDDDTLDDPFYTIRAGLDLELLPSFHIDINANYVFMGSMGKKEVLEDIDTDTVTLGLIARVGF